MPGFAFAVTVLILAGRSNDPLNQGDAVDVVGWSADEARLAVRWFDLADGSGEEELPDCPGYLDQKGAPFRGALTLAAYEGTTLIKTWLIQDYPDCTPPAEAKSRLKEAKAAIAGLGITLNPKPVAAPAYSLETENHTSAEDDEADGAVLSGTLVAWVTPKGGKRQKLTEIPVELSYSRIMGGQMVVGFYPPAFSPSGNVAVLRAYKRFSSMRGGGDTCLFARVYRWNGKALTVKPPK